VSAQLHEIDTQFVVLGKDGRALDKRTNYRGVAANHPVR
jgi:hypothetical protein